MVSADGKNSISPAPSELIDFFTQAPVPMAILSGPLHKYVSVNAPYEKMVGRSVTGKNVLEAFTEDEVGDFVDRLDDVYKTGVPYVGRNLPLTLPDEDGNPRLRYLNVGYYPLRNDSGEIHGITAIHTDVTEDVRAREAADRAKELVENERANFRNLFRQTPEMVCILRGPDHVFEFVNEAHIRALGFDATGKAVKVAQPESVEVHGILDDVYRTGKTAELHEIPVTLTDRVRYFNLTYAARRDTDGGIFGVMILGIEVSAEVEARKKMRERETYFREMVDESPAVIWITDTEGKCTYLSRRWYETTGGRPETDLGFGWTEQVHSDEREEAGREFMAAVKGRRLFSVRYRLRHKDGKYRWAVDTGLPRFASDGTYLGHIGTVIDIHEQVSSEGQLREVQSRFDKSAAATGLGVWYCDLPFDELIWNRETKEHFFLAPNARVTIKDFYDRIHPDDRERTRLAIQYSIDTHSAYDIHYRTLNPARIEDFKWIRAIGWTDYDASGRPIRFDGITLDVTKEKNREQELSAAKDEAERANQLKSAFLANMSHEIRTPLGAMIGFADLLRDPGLTGSQRSNYIDILARNGENLSVIIDDILDLSKVEAGHLTLEYTDIYPEQIVEDVISLLRVKAKEKDLALESRIEPDVPATIVSDPTRVRQILLNLVGNAIKFTQFGSVSVRAFGCHADEGRPAVCFEVIDTGIGIPESQKEKIFEMFVQADGSTTRRFGGTGLGLALSRSLARSLGGDIVITQTVQGKGSTFLITIVDQPGRRTSKTARREEKLRTPELGERSLEGVKVLVVDDSPDNRHLIWLYLNKQGAIIDSAENGLLGVKMALAGDYDVVLMDVQMPEMDGYAATAKLRQARYRKPIIALTAHAMNEVRQKVLQVGANAHLTKPINPTELVGEIAKQIK